MPTAYTGAFLIRDKWGCLMPRFEISHHPFTDRLLEILERRFPGYGLDVLEASPLLGYLNNKTRSANRGSKARGAFANHYALYVVVEDYISKGFLTGEAGIPYSKYVGARFTDLYRRQREMPFGAKLQNHGLNSRLNEEFNKFYPTIIKRPIVRDVESQRYWIQEDLLLVQVRRKDGEDVTVNIAPAIIEIIDSYVASKRAAFEGFLETCRKISELAKDDPQHAIEFVFQQLQANVDARVFEIISYAVLKAKYSLETVWIGETKEDVAEEALALYKTGRTNANDGGIDFVMKPLGRFFQVTETVDVSKYFLDIDKVQRFPITFVVKATETAERIKAAIRDQAIAKYKIEAIVESYMKAVEEIINVDDLVKAFSEVVQSGRLQEVMTEIAVQSKVEFNYSDDEEVGSPSGLDQLLEP
jgi:hypothetical protein